MIRIRSLVGRSLMLLVLMFYLTSTVAQETGGGNIIDDVKDEVCPDFDVIQQIGEICWDCFFPIVILGQGFGGDEDKIPSDNADPLCICPGRTMGIPSLGLTIGWWQPTHVIESVRQPWCSPSLGGTVLSDDDMKMSDVDDGSGGGGAEEESGIDRVLPARWGGPDKTEPDGEEPGITYYNFHWIKTPIAYVIGWLSDYVCTKPQGSGYDYAFMSEFDPSWNNDELAVWTSPETVLFTGPWAYIACAADGVAATVSKPIRAMFWCGGTWGQIYPYSGNVPAASAAPREASLNALKGLAKMHRFTLAKKTYGNKAVCKNQNYFILPKQQYRFQTLFPIAEDEDHWTGASTFRWGEWRTKPAKGEDYLWQQWGYTECCITFW